MNKPITCESGVDAVHEFFTRMSGNCAAVDYDATEPMFAPDVRSFGTKAEVVVGLDYLRENQWEKIWPNIEGFEIHLDQVYATADATLAWGMAPWSSTGFNSDGSSYDRPGRATVILERRGEQWLALHTHFSLAPGTPQQTIR